MLQVTEEQFKNLVIDKKGMLQEVASYLGVTPSCVSVRLKRKHEKWWESYKKTAECLNKKKNNRCSIKKSRIAKLRLVVTKHKGSPQKIAEELNVCTTTVSSLLNSEENKEWWECYKKTEECKLEKAKRRKDKSAKNAGC